MSRQFKNIADHGIDIGKRKRSPTQDATKEDDDVFDQDFDAPDEDSEDAGADDLPEGGDYAEDDAAAVGFNITQQFLLLEKYSGINTQKRRRAIYHARNRTDGNTCGARYVMHGDADDGWRRCRRVGGHGEQKTGPGTTSGSLGRVLSRPYGTVPGIPRWLYGGGSSDCSWPVCTESPSRRSVHHSHRRRAVGQECPGHRTARGSQ